MLVLNKTDLVQPDELSAREKEYAALVNNANIVKVSAARRHGVGELIETLIQAVPEREAEYPDEQITEFVIVWHERGYPSPHAEVQSHPAHHFACTSWSAA